MSNQLMGILGFIVVLLILGTLAWALVSGQWQLLRYGAMGLGALSATLALVQCSLLLFDLTGRFPVPAQVRTATAGLGSDAFEKPSEGYRQADKLSIAVRYHYVVDERSYSGDRYAPLDLYFDHKHLGPELQRLRSEPQTAYVSRLDVEDAVLETPSGIPELDQRDHHAADGDHGAKGPEHEAVHPPRQLADILLHALEALIGLLEALLHLREALAHQLALVPELFLDADHALAQLDLIDGGGLTEALLGEPVRHVGLDECDVFFGQVHGDFPCWPTPAASADARR